MRVPVMCLSLCCWDQCLNQTKKAITQVEQTKLEQRNVKQYYDDNTDETQGISIQVKQ